MRNLLSAEWYRLRRAPLQWLLFLLALLSGVLYGVSISDGAFDDMFIMPLFLLEAIFVSLRIGRDYSDGAIRNKIIAGKTKTAIFFSRLVMSMAACFAMTVAFLIPCFVIRFASSYRLPLPILAWTIVGFFLLNLVWATVFTFVATLISTRGVGGLLNLVLIIAVMFSAYQLEALTGQPEYLVSETASPVLMSAEEVEQVLNDTYQGNYGASTDENGVVTYYKYVVTEQETLPNPRYIPQPLNRILCIVDAALPSGQVNAYTSCLTEYDYGATEDDYPLETYPLYSLALIAGFSALGLVLFRKKDLK
jgi:hypothetical protein